jgi:hypothetical protein
MYNIPLQSIDWSKIEKTAHKGVTGKAYWQTILLDGLRIRTVEYSAAHLAGHWCQKGHIVYCLEGSFINENEGQVKLTPGISYIVSDDLSSHRSRTLTGARLLIVDGDFLTPDNNIILRKLG